MTKRGAIEFVAKAAAMFGELSDIQREVYVSALADIEDGDLEAVFEKLVLTHDGKWVPTVAKIRKEAAALRHQSGESAWADVLDWVRATPRGSSCDGLPAATREAIRKLGGSVAVRMGDEEWTRKRFIDIWNRQVDEAAAETGARIRALPVAKKSLEIEQ